MWFVFPQTLYTLSENGSSKYTKRDFARRDFARKLMERKRNGQRGDSFLA